MRESGHLLLQSLLLAVQLTNLHSVPGSEWTMSSRARAMVLASIGDRVAESYRWRSAILGPVRNSSSRMAA